MHTLRPTLRPSFRPNLHSKLLALPLCLSALPAFAEVPKVVTDMPITGALIEMVMGDLGKPDVLLPTGGDVHNYQLRPSQAGATQDADLLIWVGPALTPWLDRAATNLGGKAQSLQLLAVPGTKTRSYGGEDDDHDHAHDHDADSEHEHDHADHDHGEAGHDDHDHADAGHGEAGHVHTGTDPHAWLDPSNAQLWVKAIAGALAAQDPDHAAQYQENAEKAAARIGAVDATLTAELAPARGKPFVVLHDAYGYFTEHFGLESAIPVSLGDAATPSAARLTDIKAQLASAKAVCAFPEQNHDARLIAAVTEGTAVRPGAALDPEGSALAIGPDLYLDVIQSLAGTMLSCLKD
ncbi:zinc ABC transporter substrate-binding protein [Paracoccus aminophilus]|uniref:High-affinity zinc uptake system protein ZnuA n=1 Tax=Paracoccus aminophilus JCM 7686 TaxID=1367847 RepID=S5XKE1_PARAH|nr:zinc ABC transporter substrate-binding protein [Paracoccus aminophilus]AGT07674.1 zinc uptake system protein ZnuA [Paracoccus aminophilus JCM 7686]